MKKQQLTQKIMQKIALKEEARLRKLLYKNVFAVAVFVVVFTLSVVEIFLKLTGEKMFIILVITSIIAISYILIRTDLLSYPYRIKEIKKYKK